MSTKQEFCVNTVVSKLLTDFVQQRDFSELRETIESHKYAKLKHHVIHNTGMYPNATTWYKILFTTTDCVIVQDVLLKCGDTRFGVHKIQLSDEWENVFGEWIDENHDRYQDCDYEFRNGMRSWGANI